MAVTRYRSRNDPHRENDALGNYLATARAWERIPSLMDPALTRYGAVAALISVVLGLLGIWASSSPPPRGYFLVGSGTITGFMGFVFSASKVVLVVGVVGLVVAGVAWLRPTGLGARIAVAVECLVAGAAIGADAVMVLALVLELVLWMLLIVGVIVLVVLVLGGLLAAAVEG